VGDMIPTFMLGIPGSITGAIIMAAFILHGIQPGPQFLLSGSAPYVVFAGIILAQVLIVVFGLPLIRSVGYVVRIPNTLIAPTLTVLCFVGAFVERNIAFDIFFMILFGILGYALDRLRYSLDQSHYRTHHRAVGGDEFSSDPGYGLWSWHLFWTRPITVTFFIITLLFLVWPYGKDLYCSIRGKARKEGKVSEESSDRARTTMGEILLLGFLVLFSIVMLADARGYPKNVGFFPKLTCYTLVLLIVWRVVPMIFRRIRIAPVAWKKPWLSPGAISWEWSLGTLIGYFFARLRHRLPGSDRCLPRRNSVDASLSEAMDNISSVWIRYAGVALLARALNVILPRPF